MPENQSLEHEEKKRANRIEQHTAGTERTRAHDSAPTLPATLFSDSRLNGHGNAPVRNALALQMQQTYGNRATQRFFHQPTTTHSAARKSSVARDVQRFLQRTNSTSAPSLTVLPVQRCGGEVHAGCPCAAQDHEQPKQLQRQSQDEEEADKTPIEPVQPVSGEGKPHEVTVNGVAVQRKKKAKCPVRSPKFSIKGVTKATFNGGSHKTTDMVTEEGEGCKKCGKKNPCVHVTGTLVTEYKVTTKVTLPKPSLGACEPCEQQAVQNAINTTLADHEQEHVTAFETYNGTTEQPIDLTTCKSNAQGALKKLVTKMVAAEEKPRRADAKALSAALDPFNFDIDMSSCDEEAEAQQP